MPVTNPALKPFVIDATDIQFILDQLNFIPLFDSLGNAIINWDGTGTVHDNKGRAYTGGTLPTDAASIAAIAIAGTSYQSTTDLAGLRDVSGMNNNLSLVNANYGAVDQIFTRSAAADYANYSPIVQAVMTQAYAAAQQYYSKYAYAALYADAGHGTALTTWDGVGTVHQVGPGNTDVVITGGLVAGDAAAKAALLAYGDGGHVGTFKPTLADYTIASGGAQVDAHGNPISINNVVDYTPRMISLLTTTADVKYETWASHTILNDPITGLPLHTPNEIYYDPTTKLPVVTDWGVLATDGEKPGVGLGQVDTQARVAGSAGIGDHFIGGLNPGVAPSNGFFVLFGQFFDHGLDFIDKGGTLGANGRPTTIKIALDSNDPLYGMLGADGQPVHEITINRATVDHVDPVNGPQYLNHASPFIDQSQTYGSHEQLTTLLREWVKDPVTGQFHAGMKLFDGTTLATGWKGADWKPGDPLRHDTLPTLNELRANVIATGRAALTWEDVSNLRNRDPSDGHIIAGNSGSALLLDMNPRFDGGPSGHMNEANINAAARAALGLPATDTSTPVTFTYDVKGQLSSVTLSYTDGTGAHVESIPLYKLGPTSMGLIDPSNFSNAALSVVGHAVANEVLLESVGDHYIAGDGRVNENFGLTSIHHIFHEEHNFQVQNLMEALHTQDVVTKDATHEKLHEFQKATTKISSVGDYVVVDPTKLHGVQATGDIAITDTVTHVTQYAAAADVAVNWDMDKVFNGAKLIVEMEYQHAAVDQYARNVTPNIQEFVGYSPDKNPAVSLEYAQAAFRFGHSTLRETIDTIDPDHGLTGKIMGYALKEAFLSPEQFAKNGPGSILLGMSHQQMNEVDEFVTPALNQGLLGQPLDLAAINIARGRDIGIPTLNDFRAAIGLLKYTSWNDFGLNMQHQSSLVNFIAAYSFDGDLAKAQAIVGLVDGTILAGSVEAKGYTVEQAYGFMNGDETLGGAGTLGFNHIDTWLGGLAEVHQPGGLLGETFDKVFVNQIESLMDGDRFYYLFRLAGQQFAEEVGNGQLKDIVERNTGLTHLNGNIFGYADQYVDLGAARDTSALVANGGQAVNLTDTKTYYHDPDGTHANIDNMLLINTGDTVGNEHKYGDIASVAAGTEGIYSIGGRGNLNDGHDVVIGGTHYILDTRLADKNINSAFGQNNFQNLDATPNSGAESSEVIVGSKGNDLIYAQGGDDTVYGEAGNDTIYGGYGIDRLYGGAGADTIYGGDNPDLIDGGSGDDRLFGDSSGTDINGADQIVGGSGNDYIDGGVGIDKLSGGTGDDEIHGGQDTDPFTHGSDGNDIVDGGSGGDILYGDNGDDLVIGGADQDQLFGNFGDDILRPGDPTGALTIGTDEVLGDDGINLNDKGFDIIDFSDNTLRLGGVTFDLGNQTNPAVTVNGTPTQVQSFQMDAVIGSVGNDKLTGDDASSAGAGADISIAGNNWLIGGGGADTLEGSGGNDIIIGGHVRLDQLIGRYESSAGVLSTYDHNMANDGLTVQDQLQDALYQGASHRVGYLDSLATTGVNAGLIDAANAMVGGAHFDKHFTEMLRSFQFKDLVLGDAGASSGDTAVYSSSQANYTIRQVVAANGLVALEIAGKAGTAGEADGTDLVVGVQYLNFNGTIVNTAALYNLPPVITSNGAGATAAVTIAENTTAVTTVTATDPNGDALTYALAAGGADNGKFAINASTGALTFIAAPNFEAPTHPNNVYNVNVMVTDIYGAVDTQAIAVTVTNVNEAPTIAAARTASVLEGTTVVPGVGGATDPDTVAAFNVLTYSIVGGADQTKFTIDPATGALSFVNAPSYLAPTDSGGNNVYDVVVHVTDSGGLAAANDQAVAVTVTPNNAAPTDIQWKGLPGVNGAATTGNVNNGLPVGGTVIANLATVDPNVGNTFTYALGAGSTAGFMISTTGVVTTTSTMSPATTYTLNVTTTDNYGASYSESFVIKTGTNSTTTAGTGVDTIAGDAAKDTIIYGSGGNDTVNGGAGNDTIYGQAGNDVLNGGAGDDTFIFDISGGGGRDRISGGSNSTIGDRFVLNGTAAAENFYIYTRAAWLAVAGNTAGQLQTATTIVVARNGTNNGSVVAELNGIEEITVNADGTTVSHAVPGTTGNTTTGTGDIIHVVGNFVGTGLNYNTITVNGDAGKSTVDISGLTSDHRIVLNSGSGTGQIVGGVRPQDLVNGVSQGTATTGSGTAGGSGTSSTEGNTPEPQVYRPHVEDDTGTHSDSGATSGGGGATTVAPTVAAVGQTISGDANANVLSAGNGDNTITGLAGDDLITSGNGNSALSGGAGDDVIVAGNGNNHVLGGSGEDNVFLGNGNNWVNAGAGDDNVFSGTGHATFVDSGSDGNDSYYADGASDTLDMGAINANIQANLGTGSGGWAKAGSEVNHLYGIENIVTGSGDDTVTASAAHNIIDVGDHSATGHDTVIFRTAADANGDNILNFQAGDKIDVSAFMSGTVQLVNGTTAAAGQIAVSFQQVNGEEVTVLHGQDANHNSFEVDIKGHHALTGTDFAA